MDLEPPRIAALDPVQAIVLHLWYCEIIDALNGLGKEGLLGTYGVMTAHPISNR